MFRDTISEERAEQYKPLIGMLRCNWHEPVLLSSSEQSEIVERVRERLVDGDYAGSRNSRGIPGRGLADELAVGAIHRPLPLIRRFVPRFLNGLVAVLVVGILIGASLLLFRPALRQSASRFPVASTGPSASTEVNGLQATIHLVTVGPYFLSELVAVDVSLTNYTHAPFRIDGTEKPDIACLSSILSVQITVQVSGGNAPSYTLPMLDVVCPQPMFLTTLAPDRTLTLRYYVPVTKSGEVTMMMGGMGGIPQMGPLAGHWPSLRIEVDTQIPANRTISLHSQGTQVIIQAPAAARTHLLYRESISCDQYVGMGEGLADWSPLSTTTLSRPACPTAHKHWVYIVSAPGYAIAAGSRDS